MYYILRATQPFPASSRQLVPRERERERGSPTAMNQGWSYDKVVSFMARALTYMYATRLLCLGIPFLLRSTSDGQRPQICSYQCLAITCSYILVTCRRY